MKQTAIHLALRTDQVEQKRWQGNNRYPGGKQWKKKGRNEEKTQIGTMPGLEYILTQKC
jgi:hypothetical protein